MTLLRPKSSQSRTIDSVNRSVDSLDELDELHSESLRSEVQDLPPREQLIEAGFVRHGCGETRYAGRRYKLLLVANPKGGVGKSSLTVLLAAFSGLDQLKFRDMDPQQSTRLAYNAMFGEEVTSKRELDCELFADLEREVKKITTQNHRTILIDTPAGISVSDLLTVQVASLLLVPVSGSPVELKATHTFVTSLLSCDYAVPILIVPNKIAKQADLLNIISTFANTRCLMSAPIAFDRQIESLLDEQQFPGELDDLQDAAYPLIHSINKAVKMPVPTLSKLVQVG